jgi:hypothetical protein
VGLDLPAQDLPAHRPGATLVSDQPSAAAFGRGALVELGQADAGAGHDLELGAGLAERRRVGERRLRGRANGSGGEQHAGDERYGQKPCAAMRDRSDHPPGSRYSPEIANANARFASRARTMTGTSRDARERVRG